MITWTGSKQATPSSLRTKPDLHRRESGQSALPRRNIQSMLVGRTAVYGLSVAMRNDDLLKWNLQQFTQCWQRTLFMPWRTPHPKGPTPLCQTISKNNHSLLRKPERSLKTPSSIVKRDETSRKYLVRLQHL